MKTIKKIQLEATVAGHPRIIEFELPTRIPAKEADTYLKGVTDLLETLEANTQSQVFDTIVNVINSKGIFVEGN